MTVKLLMDHMSQPSRAVHLFLLETGIPFTIEQKLLAKGEHVSKEMKKLNPNMQLPTLVDGDFSIYESHAIMKYLQRAYPGYVADHWYPADVRLRARVDAMLDWHHNNLRRGAAGLIFATLLFKVRRPSATAEDQAHLKKEATFNLKNALKRLNDDYCTMGPFLHGMSDITIADLSSAQELVMLDLVGFDYLTDYPNVRAWLERVKSRTQKNWSITNAALDKIVAKNRAKASATGAHMNGQLTTNKTAGNGNASGPWSANGNALQSGAIMTEIQSQLSGPEGAEAIKKLQATFKFIIGDPAQGGACWLLDLKNGGVKELTGDEIASTKADSTFSLSDANFVSLATGKLNPQVAFLGGKLKLHGNLAKAMAFNSNVFQKPTIKAKLVEATSKIIKAKL